MGWWCWGDGVVVLGGWGDGGLEIGDWGLGLEIGREAYGIVNYPLDRDEDS